MAAAARTALLRSVFTKMARRPGPGPASSSSRRFSSSPNGASTPPATNNSSKDAARNKVDPSKLDRAMGTFIKVTKVTERVMKFIVIVSLMDLLFVLIPMMDEIKEDMRRRDRIISNVEEGMIQEGKGDPMEKKDSLKP